MLAQAVTQRQKNEQERQLVKQPALFSQERKKLINELEIEKNINYI